MTMGRPAASRTTLLATLALVGYCVATAVSSTWVSISFGGISGTGMTFVTFLLAQLIYTARAGGQLGATLRFAKRNLAELLYLNVLTLGSWLLMFLALQRIEASVESAVFQGTVAIIGFVLAALVTGQRFSRTTKLWIAASSCLLALLVAARVETVSSPVPRGEVWIGLALALVAGATGGLYIYRSSQLHRRTQVSATTVLCLRFLLLLVVTGALSGRDMVALTRSDPAAIGQLLLLSITFVVLPTFLLQYAIAHLPSVRVSSATPLVPIIALGSEYVVRPWGSIAAPLIVVLASVALILTNYQLSRDLHAADRPLEGRPADAGNDDRWQRDRRAYQGNDRRVRD